MNEQTIFTAALERPSAERAEFLDSACAHDPAMRGRLEKLLASHEEIPSFLDHPAVGVATALHPATFLVGTQIGPYKLREQIGEGGMGVVYVAEQTEPVNRKVALKIIKPGMASKDVVARFESERQALAVMDHPNIAKVFDGGATEIDQPYFVMELVQGLPITEYCDLHKLGTRARLELFEKVCRAVQHAHQKGVIHRDLKPTNVLVPEIDGAAVPKVIDFGVAKAVGQRLTDQTVYTQFSQLVGTPLYMSPEQAGLGVVDVDTRSDVYSLGVLLYELLTGSTPFDSDTLKQAGFDEMRRIIREDEPARPSDRVSTLAAEALSTVAASRGSEPRKLSTSLKGELDWLVMKALEKDRNRRYETANALAADVNRYLEGEPVEACPPSPLYHFRKFARRNKSLITTSAIVLTSLFLGILGTTWQARRAKQALEVAETNRRQAEQQRELTERSLAKSEAIISFFEDDVLGAARPSRSRGRDLTVNEALKHAESKIEKDFQDKPFVEATIRRAVGRVHRRLGNYHAAEQHFRRSLTLLSKESEELENALLTQALLGAVINAQGRHQEAEELLRKTLAAQQELLGERHLHYSATLGFLAQAIGVANAQDIKKARELYEAAYEICAAESGAMDADSLACQHNIAMYLMYEGKLDEAKSLFQDMHQMCRAALGEDHPHTIHALNGIGQIHWERKNLQKAREVLEQVLENHKRILGANHPEVISTIALLANTYMRLEGSYSKGMQLAMDTANQAYEEQRWADLGTVAHLTVGYMRKGRTNAIMLFYLAISRGHSEIDNAHKWGTEAYEWACRIMDELPEDAELVRLRSEADAKLKALKSDSTNVAGGAN